MASVVVLKKFVNLHYNRGVAGGATLTDLIIQVKEGSHTDHQRLMFSLSCIHKFRNTIYILCVKYVDSNASDEASVIQVSCRCQIL